MNILITGCSGFIGFHLSDKLAKNKKNKIFGIDNLNSYYDVSLKKSRLKILNQNTNFFFKKIDIEDNKKLKNFFKKLKIDIVIHLAAQAGVRYALKFPDAYIKSNLNGFFNIIELSRLNNVKKFYFASSSSVYGSQKKYPTNESSNTDHPLSLYAATKKSNELIAYSYFNIYGFSSTALRFFTVYGPYGRPDMSLFKFTKAIFENKSIELFNNGDHIRDFTYISDVITAISKLLTKSQNGYNVYNISSSNPQKLKYFLKVIENIIGKKPKFNKLQMQKGDVYKTHGNSSLLKKKINFVPKVKIEDGILEFIKWYKNYYKINE
jgi:UDP-glucuronate 4-epimerase